MEDHDEGHHSDSNWSKTLAFTLGFIFLNVLTTQVASFLSFLCLPDSLPISDECIERLCLAIAARVKNISLCYQDKNLTCGHHRIWLQYRSQL